MAIDFSPLSRIKSVGDFDQERQARQMNALQLLGAQQKQDEYSRSVADANALRQIQHELAGTAPEAYGQALRQRGRFNEGMAADKAYFESQKAKVGVAKDQSAIDKDKLAMAIDTHRFMGDVIGGATDQQSYSQGLEAMRQRGLDVSKIPAQFDPAYVANAASLNLTQKQRLEEMWKQQEFDRNKDKDAQAAANDYMVPDGKGGFVVNQPLLNAKSSVAKAGASSVSINTGQKGYENESKLRNDFKSEPIYKDYADMKTAYSQIKAGIKQGTPIADTAVATKMMKLLDPGSVVRESELGIAMAAGGRMDRLENYIQMQMSGNKLTPTQRQDFGKLADELMGAAEQSYNSKRKEYEDLGSRYKLDTNVLGAPSAIAKPAGKPAARVDPSSADPLGIRGGR